MKINMPHTLKVTLSYKLIQQLIKEHDPKSKVEPKASYAVIGKLVESCKKEFKNIQLDYKGD